LAKEGASKVCELINSVEDKANNLANIRLELWKSKEEKRIREDALRRSDNVMKGKISEHMAPFGKDFTFNPSDCRFLGSPIDYVVFDGLENDKVDKVVFLEIKTGEHARLTPREKAVRDAIKDGRVDWQLISL
jgi:predicted Holliday junction resolvase-like endonuclease